MMKRDPVARALAMPSEKVRKIKLNVNWGALIFEVARVVIAALAGSMSGGTMVKAARKRKAAQKAARNGIGGAAE